MGEQTGEKMVNVEKRKAFESLCTVEAELNIALSRIEKLKRYVLGEDEEGKAVQPGD